MCGITGAFSKHGETQQDFRYALQRMTDVIAHRGPDDEGCWDAMLPDGSFVGLGSRRLAILDLSPAGHMPMTTTDANYTIVYNGEIYNYPELKSKLEARGYRFRSRSDTEAILYLFQEYGPDCVQHLNGMFAIAVWDSLRQRLFLARDHFGIKPLYYTQSGGNFAFGSEVKSLLQIPWVTAAINPSALSQFLTFTWVPDPDTMFRGIHKLPAGHFAMFHRGELNISQYWDLALPKKGYHFRASEEDLAEEVRSRFARSVKSQLLSDVPVGAFLSAGLDSSGIVGVMAKEVSDPVRTYTITFPSKYLVGEKTLDNPAVPRRLAHQLGCQHHEIVVEPEIVDLLPRIVWHMDEPVADPAIIAAYLVCKNARDQVTVLLSGIGGDEVFAGYRKHYAHFWSQAYQKVPHFLRQGFEKGILNLPAMRGSSVKGTVRLLKKMARSGSLSPRESFLSNCAYFTEPMKSVLLQPDISAVARTEDPFRRHYGYFEKAKDSTFLDQMLYLDLKAFMVSLNLTYNDKMSMASSLEVRVPFLDRE